MLMLFIVGVIVYILVITYEGDPKPKQIAPKVAWHKFVIYVLDEDTGGVSLYYEWYDKSGPRRENMGVTLKMSQCPKVVQEMLTDNK